MLDSSSPAEPTPQPLQVTAALVREKGRFLISQRRSGRWEFPGGKQEPGEGLAQCLAREMAEELGVKVEVGERFGTIDHAYPDKRVRLHFFRCRIVAGRPRPLTCRDLAWVTFGEMAEYDFLEADQRIIDRLRRAGEDSEPASAPP